MINALINSWRNLRNERFFSVLNMLGLATALTCSAFIALWVWDEWRRDRYFPNAERIVRVASKVITETETFSQAVTSIPTGPTLLHDYPEVESFVRFTDDGAIVRVGEQQFLEEKLLTVDTSFFSIYNYKLKNGDTQTALDEPFTVVLTEKLARKYFGDQDPVGRTFRMMLYDTTGKGAEFRVTGVLSGRPRPSHFDFDMLISFSTFLALEPEAMSEDGWGNNSYHTYLLLKPGADRRALEAKLPGFYEKYLQPIYLKYGVSLRYEFFLQPLSDIYLHSDLRYEIAPTGDAGHLFIFGTVGLLILFVAGINYVNMATARSAKRARGVGVRKALGAQRGQLMGQFLLESVMTAILSAGIALALGGVLEPLFQDMTGKEISLFDERWLLLFVGSVATILGLGAGIYPALAISGFNTVNVLKGNAALPASGGAMLRKVLVTTQFSLSIALIICVLTIRGQMDYIHQKDLGYNKEALLSLRVNGDPAIAEGIEAFRNDVTQNSAYVSGMAVANKLPIGGTGNSGASTVDQSGKKIQSSTYRFFVDQHYADVFGLKFLAGRNFSLEFPADWPTDSSQNFILNEAAVKAFGWESPEAAIGKPFSMWGRKGQVIGIVQDFHFNTLKRKVEPLALLPTTRNFSSIVLRIDMKRPAESVAAVEAAWRKHFPSSYFDYGFVDEKLDIQYRSDLRFGALFGVFSVFSIFIACLGMTGLAAYTAEQRTREIGIRKVLGATVSGLMNLLAKDFLLLVLIAFFIAAPLAYYFMEQWLAEFAYRIDMQVWMFVTAGLVTAVVAFITVSLQSIRAALANPVKSLRSE